CIISSIQTQPSHTLFPYTTLFRSRYALALDKRLFLPSGDAAIKRSIALSKSAIMNRATSERGARSLAAVKTSLSSGKVVVTIGRSEEHTSELQSRENLVCRLLLEK